MTVLYSNSVPQVNHDLRKIYFNEEEHKYVDDLGNVYTSVTTVIGNYAPKFDEKLMAKRVRHKRTSKYYMWSERDIIADWDRIRNAACDRGNNKHNFLEDAIKTASRYKKNASGIYINDMIYTVPDIMKNHNYGEVDLEYFEKLGIKEKYPEIYNTIAEIVSKGYKVYSEIGVYSYKYLISGLIDVLFVKGNDIVILDWKTNTDPLSYKSGYFKKDSYGKRTKEWVYTNEYMFKPLDHLEASNGNKYTLQLSLYSFLCEMFGFNLKTIILCHIRELEDEGNKEQVEFHLIDYKREDVYTLCETHLAEISSDRNTQMNLFN